MILRTISKVSRLIKKVAGDHWGIFQGVIRPKIVFYQSKCRPGKTEGAGRAMAPPLFRQAKLYVELDFKIPTEVSNFEIIHSKY